MSGIDNNIQKYRRKFYANQIVKSLVWFSLIWGVYYLLISILEYFFWLSPNIRTAIMVTMVVASIGTLVYFIIIPILRSYNIIPTKSEDEAAEEIGGLFPEIQDKLLNFLQLRSAARKDPNNPWLIRSARQKEKQVDGVDFSRAINIPKNNWKGLRYLMVFVALFIGVLMFFPALITDSAERLWNPTQKFEPQAPFNFRVDPQSLRCVEGDPLIIRAQLDGESIPEELDIRINDEVIAMINEGPGKFSYKLDRVMKGFEFDLESAPFHSQKFTVEVIEKMDANDLKLYIDYPSHVSRKDEFSTAMGDLQIPEGTRLTWSVKNPQLKTAMIRFSGGQNYFKENNRIFGYSLIPQQDEQIDIVLYSRNGSPADTIETQVNIIKDQAPSVVVQNISDTSQPSMVVLTGEAADDYGLAALSLVYKIKTGSGTRYITKHLPLDRKKYTNINTLIDFKKMKLPPGSSVEYYVQATDNDVVHGGKTSKSASYFYESPSLQEIQKEINQLDEKAISALSQGQSNSKKTEQSIEESKKSLISGQSNSFETKQSFQQIKKNNESIKKNLEEFLEKMKKKDELQKDPENDLLKEKKEDLEKLAENLLQDKIDKQLERINKLMEQLDKKKANMKQLEDIQQEQKNIENELERLEELAKRLEMQVDMDKLAKKIDSAAVEELRLAMKMQQEQTNKPQLDQDRKKQKDLMQDVNKELQELNEKNKDLEAPFKMDKVMEESKKAESNIAHSDESRKDNKMKKASDHSKDANKNMMNMSEMLSDMANDEDMEEMEEDIAAMRRILQNLLKISFFQEDLIETTKKLNKRSPKFREIGKQERQILERVQLIEDSLRKIAAKDMKMGARMNEELEGLLLNINQSITDCQDRNNTQAINHQSFSMMHVNNLTLFFGEGLNSKMASMNSKKQSKGKPNASCNKPGGKSGNKPGKGKSGQMRDIITGQKKLGDQMQQMMNAESSKKNRQGGKKPKKGQGKSQPGNEGREQQAETMARLAQLQEDLQRRIQELNSELKKDGKGLGELQDAAKDMDKAQDDILHRNLMDNMMARQEEILTKLLKAEEAIREQEQGEKRAAQKVAEYTPSQIPAKLLPYIQNTVGGKEYLKKLPPNLNAYYQEMIQKYFQNLQ